MFRYPCSYLVHSPSFDALPERMIEYVARRLDEVLSGKDESKEFSHLSAADRLSIREILVDTKPDLALRWSRATAGDNCGLKSRRKTNSGIH